MAAAHHIPGKDVLLAVLVKQLGEAIHVQFGLASKLSVLVAGVCPLSVLPLTIRAAAHLFRVKILRCSTDVTDGMLIHHRGWCRGLWTTRIRARHSSVSCPWFKTERLRPALNDSKPFTIDDDSEHDLYLV